jgi:hypothetical protein
MDLFNQHFGLVLILIPTIGGIVKTTVDMCKGAFELLNWQLFLLNFGLNFLLFPLVLFVLVAPESRDVTFAIQSIVGGWMAANWAAMQTDAHNAARKPKVDDDADPASLS